MCYTPRVSLANSKIYIKKQSCCLNADSIVDELKIKVCVRTSGPSH